MRLGVAPAFQTIVGWAVLYFGITVPVVVSPPRRGPGDGIDA